MIFDEPRDFRRFLQVLAEARSRYPVELYGYCVMPNHWHLLAMSPVHDGISSYMQWVTGTHGSRHRRVRGTIGLGHVYKDRFWAKPMKNEQHLITALRYIEANPKRAGLVRHAEDWRWSSAWERRTGSYGLVSPLPVDLPPDWNDLLNVLLPSAVNELRRS